MLGTSTHDTKRGEDTRARLAVLSEMPDEWERHVNTWSRILRARRGDVEGTAPPDRNDEYLFYQLLLGAWPAELTGTRMPEPEALRGFAERMEGAMVKSMREAKRHTTWAAPNTTYEEGMLGFLREALDPSRSGTFLDAFLPFQERVARLGFRNSLVQTALKLTLPGMPDIYQGTELWDLSLVDPDNRRPVDYGLRTELLEEVSAALASDRPGATAAMLREWHDGRLKLALTATLLTHRREHPALYAEGAYEPVAASGPKADHLCAFARSHGEHALLVVAARFPARLETEPGWGDTKLVWPQATAGARHWRDLLSGRVVERSGEAFAAGALLGEQPVTVLALDSRGRS
jgi:(1->4)-alpha-D-glucan 1-alpha-D-glucosylmutase